MRAGLGILLLCFACGEPPPTPAIDASKAKSFVVYQQQLIPLEREWAKAKGPVPVNSELEALRAAIDLTEEEVTALHEIGTVICMRDETLKRNLERELAEQQQALARTPEPRRADAQRGLDNLKSMKANVFELAEMRQKYGNPIVDAMLQQEAELKRQRLELASIR